MPKIIHTKPFKIPDFNMSTVLRESTESIDTQDDLLPLLERLGISTSSSRRFDTEKTASSSAHHKDISENESLWSTRHSWSSRENTDEEEEHEVVYLLDSDSDHDDGVFHKTRIADEASSLSHTMFMKTRESVAREMFQEYNELIFDSQLPPNVDISWNVRLATTAGLTHYSRRYNESGVLVYTARIELASKVLDTVDRLERTLIHEMCHCASWLIDHVAKPPHGQVFKKWADRAMTVLPRVDVSTCHNYDIFYPHRWQCTACFHEYKRHSKSIDIDKKVCGSCRGRLEYLGKFTRHGDSPQKKGNMYSAYVAKNFSKIKKASDPGTSAVDVMKKIAAMWHVEKKTTTPACHT